MNEFVQKFEERLYGFWDADEEETKNLLSEILQYANANQQTFISDVNEVRFDDDLSALPIVLEALSTDTEKWGNFYIDILNSIIETAKQSDKPNDILTYLKEFKYIETDDKPFVQKIVDRLYKELNAEKLEVKLASIWQLPNYLDNNSIRNKRAIIDSLQQQLCSDNWKVRVATYKSLGFAELIPNGYKLSIKDSITKLIFGEPPII